MGKVHVLHNRVTHLAAHSATGDSRPMRSVLISWLLCILVTVPARADDVLVFAAVSLAGPLDIIARHFEDETGHSVTISYGASSTLARQVEAGAPADVVVLANEAWMDHLDRIGALQVGTRHTLLSNRLVLIGTFGTGPIALGDLVDALGRDRLALALTEAVPAGIYARAALETLGLWDVLRPNIVEMDNVRVAQQLVAIGAARYGIVYATDAIHEPRVTVLSDIPQDLHPPIRYPVAVTATGAMTQSVAFAAERFAGDLAGLFARNVFTDAGFGLVEE